VSQSVTAASNPVNSTTVSDITLDDTWWWQSTLSRYVTPRMTVRMRRRLEMKNVFNIVSSSSSSCCSVVYGRQRPVGRQIIVLHQHITRLITRLTGTWRSHQLITRLTGTWHSLLPDHLWLHLPLCLRSASDWKPICSLSPSLTLYTGLIYFTSPSVVSEVIYVTWITLNKFLLIDLYVKSFVVFFWIILCC